jgi:riboflavin synthase
MFTGLIEETGAVAWVRRSQSFQQLGIRAATVLAELRVGDSVSIDGVCQTVVAIDAGVFMVESVAETLHRTTLGRLTVGQAVNLERALRADGRLGGHLVLGHVDGVGAITALAPQAESWVLRVAPPPALDRFIAAKGSVAIDGISLTVAEVQADGFAVAVIPHTFHHTTLAQRRAGDPVNLEVDVVARYLDRLLSAQAPAGGLTLADLRRMGY